jgi:plasmid stabilization system protein ParE
VYLAENADESIADRFLESAQDTFAQLAQAPLMGSPVGIKTAELADLRKWRVKEFEKFFIFYSTLPTACPLFASCTRLKIGGNP